MRVRMNNLRYTLTDKVDELRRDRTMVLTNTASSATTAGRGVSRLTGYVLPRVIAGRIKATRKPEHHLGLRYEFYAVRTRSEPLRE